MKLVLLGVLAALIAALSANAANTPLGACTVTPNPSAVDVPVTVNATGISTLAPVYVIVTRPDGSSFFAGNPSTPVNPDGTASFGINLNQAGTWAFVWSAMVKEHGKYFYTADASCTASVS